MKDVILSIYLSIYLCPSVYRSIYLSVYLSVYLSICPPVRPSLSLLKLGPIQPHSTLPYPQYPPLSLPYTASIPIEIGPKRLRAETTQGRNDPGLKRLTYLGRNDPPQKLAETTRILGNGSLKCHRVLIPTTPSFGDKVICWYTGFTFKTSI